MSKIGRYFCWFHVRISLLGELTTCLMQNLCISHQTSESYKHLQENSVLLEGTEEMVFMNTA